MAFARGKNGLIAQCLVYLARMKADDRRWEEFRGVRVLVTGATGFTGSVLTRKLVAAGAAVTALVRSDPPAALDQGSIRWVRGQVYDEAVVREAMRGVAYVFHVAAAYREAGLVDEVYRQVHVTSTRLIAEAAQQEPGFRRLIHVSTVGVHGHIENPPADETAPFHPGDLYQETKAEAEQWLRAFAASQALSYTIIRPAAIMGPDDDRLLKVFKLATKPVFPMLGYGKCLYHLIHVEDLTDAMLVAASHPAAEHEAFIVGNTEPIRLEDFGRLVADTLGYPFRPVRIPVTPFFWAAAVCEAVCKPFGLAPPLHRRRVAFFTKDRAFNTAKLRDRLGFVPRYTNESGIRETARGYVAKGWLKARV